MYSIDPNRGASRVKVVAVEAERALERAWRPCQQGMAVVNLAAGCSFGCLFCPLHVGGNSEIEIQVKANLPVLLETELATRRRAGKLPSGIVLNTTSDSFQEIGPLLTLTHEAMQIALSENLDVFLQTRGLVPEGFAELLNKHRGRVHVQVVLFSMDEALTKLFEPNAPSPQERIESIRRLIEWGVDVHGRIEPLVPFVSDTAGHLEDLVRHLRSVGLRHASVAYLVLKPQMLERFQAAMPAAHFHVIRGSFRGQTWRKIGIHQMTRLLSDATRTQGYQRLRNIAKRAGMTVSVCGCQDPLLGVSCQPLSSAVNAEPPDKFGQLDLFPTG